MSKKQARKTAQGEASLTASVTKSQPKALVVTPQVPVTIHGTYPDQYLTVESFNGVGRKKVVLTAENAYSTLLGLLMEKAGEIELERQLLNEQRAKAPRRRKQPDWRLIAKHAQAEIHEGLVDASLCEKGSITVLPTRARELIATKSDKTLDEMGL